MEEAKDQEFKAQHSSWWTQRWSQVHHACGRHEKSNGEFQEHTDEEEQL
jgi:hypothetical protein